MSKEYVPNDSDNNEFYHKLYGGEKYYIQVDCIKGTPEAKITIYYPPKPKQ